MRIDGEDVAYRRLMSRRLLASELACIYERLASATSRFPLWQVKEIEQFR
jgi:hypothetical protein